jgi:hypothetical protein
MPSSEAKSTSPRQWFRPSLKYIERSVEEILRMERRPLIRTQRRGIQKTSKETTRRQQAGATTKAESNSKQQSRPRRRASQRRPSRREGGIGNQGLNQRRMSKLCWIQSSGCLPHRLHMPATTMTTVTLTIELPANQGAVFSRPRSRTTRVERQTPLG